MMLSKGVAHVLVVRLRRSQSRYFAPVQPQYLYLIKRFVAIKAKRNVAATKIIRDDWTEFMLAILLGAIRLIALIVIS